MYSPTRSGNGVAALVSGILAFVGFGCLTGLPALILGKQTLKDIDRGVVDPGERGIAQAGYILGIVSTSLFAIAVALYLLFFASIFGPMLPPFGNAIEEMAISNSESENRVFKDVAEEIAAHPKKTPAEIAKQFNGMKPSPYHPENAACGNYVFSGHERQFVVIDGCGNKYVREFPAPK